MARALPRLIKRHTRRVIETTPLADDPSELNAGHCRRLAEAVIEEYGGRATMWAGWASSGRRHFFIKSDGRYYDAERPGGVERPSQLPFFGGDEPKSMEREDVDAGIDGDIGGRLNDLF